MFVKWSSKAMQRFQPFPQSKSNKAMQRAKRLDWWMVCCNCTEMRGNRSGLNKE